MTLNLRLVAVAIISVLLLQAVLLAVVPRLVKENDGAALSSRRFTAAISSVRHSLATSVFGEENTAGDDDGGDRDSGLQHNGGRDSARLFGGSKGQFLF